MDPCIENERTRTTESVSARDQANSTLERVRRCNASPRTEEKVRRGVDSASAETEEPAEPGHHDDLHLPFLHLLRHARHLQGEDGGWSSASSLCSFICSKKTAAFCGSPFAVPKWKRSLEIRRELGSDETFGKPPPHDGIP